jgi:hypothetical protein
MQKRGKKKLVNCNVIIERKWRYQRIEQYVQVGRWQQRFNEVKSNINVVEASCKRNIIYQRTEIEI